ncbi:MAG: coproporphyrinogen dehydrogenase HemZ [Megasphaera sp.]|nr:coproporphyrinogen dehydrogenase HemZ [Megasphaera sp.]
MKIAKKSGQTKPVNLKLQIMDEQGYRYKGPEGYHSFIGQVMAHLGYVGGYETGNIGAHILLSDENGIIDLTCVFIRDDKKWKSRASIIRCGHTREDIKNCLIHWHERFTGNKTGPWGTLMGVRPTKLVHHFFDRGFGDKEIITILQQQYRVEKETAERLVHMSRLQRPFVMEPRNHVALYVGIPYCSSHCLYCSFPSRLVGKEEEAGLQAFSKALETDLQDLNKLCRQYSLTVDTIYIGGGTPTCLPIAILKDIIQSVAANFSPVQEWTVEAGRPDTATKEKLALLRQYGVDRISVNPQTMQQRILDVLGRHHRVEDIYTMFNNCRDLGFSVINMDFIAGLPVQNVKDMQENMEIVCQLWPENVTIHTLALKKRAPLFHHPLRDRIPSQEEVTKMLEYCDARLVEKGYIPYYMYRQKYMAASFANVGYAFSDAIGKYNIQMMEERQTVLAAGPGGATKFINLPEHRLEKLYMPKEVNAYMASLEEKMQLRRKLCTYIYGREDR